MTLLAVRVREKTASRGDVLSAQGRDGRLDAENDVGGDGIEVGVASRRRSRREIYHRLTVANQSLATRHGPECEFQVLDLIPQSRPIEHALLETRKRWRAVRVDHRPGRLRVFAGAFHRNRLSWPVGE